MKGCLRKQKFEYFRCSSPKSTLLSPQQLGKFNSFKKLVESKIISKSDRSLCHASPDQSDKVNRGTNQRTLFYNFIIQAAYADNVSHLQLEHISSINNDISLGSAPAPLVKGKSMPSLR